ncbi:hypothetical protein [Labrys miyagiensis]|uniref:hypothetical protein n=1 Tax=Labrys miyagiensis TaxID=346912 RepID=UPI0024E18AD8|nr:hypothetical protein [Labrys miyagiensis]
MARDIDKKLRLTAALLGAVTSKDLAKMFRRVNSSTSFDVNRAYKWLQGRARPRERQLYEDWAKVLDLDRSGDWVAECDTESFLGEICARHHRDPDTLRGRAEASIALANGHEPDLALTGVFACYSHAWSPYFRGRLIRGELSIAIVPNPRRLVATYAEVLPTGRLQLEGSVTVGKRLVRLNLRERAGDAEFFLCLFPASPPVSILGGLMCGGTIIDLDARPSVTRIAIVRLPTTSARLLHEAESYLPANGLISHDLAALGLPIADTAAVDQRLGEFLSGVGNGIDQISLATYGRVVELFDRAWLAQGADATA